jgi:thiamine-phosphate pyrophosphorylase
VLGLQGYSNIIAEMKRRGLEIPVVAIGGITASDIPQIMQTGMSGIAVSGAVLNAENPAEEMKRLIKIESKR